MIVLLVSFRLGGCQELGLHDFFSIVYDERKGSVQFKVAAVQQSVSHFVAARKAGCTP